MSEFNEVLTATAKAMAAIKKVAKDGRNEHDKYNFASIDDFLAMVNPICADAGLIFHMEESGIEDFTRKGKYGDSSWMRMVWSITVYHVSGQCLPPVRRTVEVLRNGAQAYGSSQSFALKQFLRSYLLIATGDKDDADLRQTDDGMVDLQPKKEPRKDEPPTIPQEAIDTAKTSLFNADTLGQLREIYVGLPRDVAAHRDIVNAKDARKAELDKPSNADLGGDAIPYN